MSFEEEIERITARLDTAGPRLQGLFGNLNRALNALLQARPAGATAEERGVLLAFEEVLLEALTVSASLLHQRGDLGGARECLDLVQRLRDLVQGVIEGE